MYRNQSSDDNGIMQNIQKIDIIGRGNVATHLYNALISIGYDVKLQNPHSEGDLRRDTDLALICVSDNAIQEVSDRISRMDHGSNMILAHTSGSTSISILGEYKGARGVFYPMQTLSKDVALDYTRIPLFIEGSDVATEQLLLELAQRISEISTKCDSEQRRKLHVASVFCCNFTNHLWALASEYLHEAGIEFHKMQPLIEETVRKAFEANPRDVQTGPAVRGDSKTMDAHLHALSDYPEMQEIYKILSNSIQHTK